MAATVITVACAYFALRGVDFEKLEESLRQTNYWWLVPAFALLVVACAMRVVRWRLLFPPASRPPLGSTTQALLIGQFFNTVLPFRAGEAARVVALSSLGRRSSVEVAGTVVIERVLDVLALLLFLLVSLPWLPEVTWVRAGAALAVGLGAGLAAFVLVLQRFGERPLRFVVRPLERLPFVSEERVESLVRELMHGLVGIRSARVGLIAFAWTTASWLVVSASFWLVMIGFGLGLSPGAGLLAVIASSLSLILPSAPAALGVFEGATILALAGYGVAPGTALSYALVVHALNVLPYLPAGLLLVKMRTGVVKPDDAGRLQGRGVARRLARRLLRTR